MCVRELGLNPVVGGFHGSRIDPGFVNLGDASPKWGHEMILGGRELDSRIINISLILSTSFYFPGLKCYIVQCQAFSHILILT